MCPHLSTGSTAAIWDRRELRRKTLNTIRQTLLRIYGESSSVKLVRWLQCEVYIAPRRETQAR